MTQRQEREPQSRKIENARDLQAQLYREIGISAVAAALRFTTQPDPFAQSVSDRSASHAQRGTIAA